MNITGATANFGSIEHGASFLTMKKTLDTVEQQMDGIIDMMEKSQPQQISLASHLGQNFDIKI